MAGNHSIAPKNQTYWDRSWCLREEDLPWGKIASIQVEYARCVLMIVKNKEDDNDIMEAANILQEVQV
jgi:hypothetical protein